MMELAPEMVAVVFHQGFRFTRAAPLEQALAVGQDHLPSWESLSTCISLEPWAAALAKTVLAEPGGDRFMVIAAGLEYLQQARFAGSAVGGEADAEGDEDDADDREHDDDYDALSADDVVEPTRQPQPRKPAQTGWPTWALSAKTDPFPNQCTDIHEQSPGPHHQNYQSHCCRRHRGRRVCPG